MASIAALIAAAMRARAVFAAEKKRRPRGRYMLRQNIRVLERWPPDGA
jgi:hypothetical protein